MDNKTNQSSSSAPDLNQNTPPERKSFSKLKLIVLVLAGVLILVGLGIGGYYLLKNGNSTPVSNVSSDYGGSPFGVLDFGSFSDAKSWINDIGIKTVRYGGNQGVTYWAINKPENMPPGYPKEFLGWDHLDSLYKETHDAGIEMSIIINSDEIPDRPDTNLTNLTGFKNFTPHGTGLTLQQYSDFVKYAVERYDGDGVDDAPGSPVVTYWEIDNEPDISSKLEPYFLWKGDLSLTPDYARVVKAAYKAIKSANPNAKVALGSMNPSPDYFEQVFKELEKLKDSPNDKFFDVFNFHLYGDYREYGQKTFNRNDGMPLAINMAQIKTLLEKYDYLGVEIINTESGTTSGGNDQTQAQQAGNLLKRYVYLASQGVSRHYWYRLAADVSSSPEDSPTHALVTANKGKITKKLGYYTYKLMVDKLEGSDWNNVKEVYSKDNVYAYKLINGEKSTYILWWDYFDESAYSNRDIKTVSISDLGISGKVNVTEAVPKYESGKNVTDYSAAFNTGSGKISGGKLTVKLGQSPVYVEESDDNLAEYLPMIFSQSSNETNTPQESTTPTTQGGCGDGVCDDFEKNNSKCPQDCE